MRLVLAFAMSLVCAKACAQDIRFVGKSVMFPSYPIIRSLLDSRDHRDFIKAARAVKLDQPFLHAGPMTVFAPTDKAFDALSGKWHDWLVRRTTHDAVAKVLACHIVTDPRFAGKTLSELLKDKDEVMLPTLGGCRLFITKDAAGYAIGSASGTVAHISNADIRQSNGIIEIIDTVILPNG